MRYLLYFVLSFLGWAVLYLTFDLDADFSCVGIVSLGASVITLLAVRFTFKPLKKWYRKNFSKSYRLSRGYDD
ncbi:MAG: hypothetical protein BGO69_08690 [Bacteroidetes bacterium 46-16]|jgi:hypothetical protein|nr:MAG: hypothetical protein BGO69_08690 [Bacteroidetes bacterium 46-16]